MHIVRCQTSTSEALVRELLAMPYKPVAVVVVGESDSHRQSAIDFLGQSLGTGFGCNWGSARCYRDAEIGQFAHTFSCDIDFRFINVDEVHSGQPEARRTIVRRLLNGCAKTVVMLWADFHPSDPPLDWAGTLPTSSDNTRVFKWDPAVPECRPHEDEADYFYHLSP